MNSIAYIHKLTGQNSEILGNLFQLKHQRATAIGKGGLIYQHTLFITQLIIHVQTYLKVSKTFLHETDMDDWF